jgi:hypothetical protein
LLAPVFLSPAQAGPVERLLMARPQQLLALPVELQLAVI